MADEQKVRIPDLLVMKAQGRKIVVLTAYDCPTARLADEAGVDVILVGDSLGMVVLGYETTLPVTMEEMLIHVKAVARGCRRALIVADMPFLSYQGSPDEAVMNAGRMLKEGGAHAVKLEGGESIAPLVSRLAASGIPVMGHVGLLPQSVHQLGGHRVQGKTADAARRMLRGARALQDAGAFSVVLELVPRLLAEAITKRLSVPTIGIGSGAMCDGQVQVVNDLIGLADYVPRHARRLLDLRSELSRAFETYAAEVREEVFPAPDQGAEMDAEELRKALQE